MVDACHHCHHGNLQGHPCNIVFMHVLEGLVECWLMLPSQLQHSALSGGAERQTLTHKTGGQYHRSTARLQSNRGK